MNAQASNLPNLEIKFVSSTEIQFVGVQESIKYFLKSTSGVIGLTSAQYCSSSGELFDLNPSLIKGVEIGEGNTHRKVFHFLDKQYKPNQGLRSGLTVHTRPGQWSSLPHDFELSPEPGFEEIFFYGLSGGEQQAIQVKKGVFHDLTKIDSCELVTDRSSGIIPMGFHPVVGLPNVSVSYLWAYIAKQPHWEKVK